MDADARWCEFTALTPPHLVETAAALLREAAPGGIAVEEPFEALGPEEGYRVRAGEPVALRAWLPATDLGGVLAQRLREALAAFPDIELRARPLRERDWATSWREFFGPVTVGRIAIVPTWVDYAPERGQLVVRIDPGQAFGTGHHETTRLCLAALQASVRAGMRALDVGAGSGILSIAAVRLGAASVEAFEIDPVAAEAARAACAANGMDGRVTVRGAFPAEVAAPVDVAVANVSARADIAFAEALAAALRPGGRLIASGFPLEDRTAALAAFEAHGLTLAGERAEGGWALLELTAGG